MLFIPGNCWLCRQPLQLPHHGICSCCLRAIPPLPPLCRRCGLARAPGLRYCPYCVHHRPAWQTLIAVSDYSPPLRQLIHKMKFSGVTALALPLARLLLLTLLARRRSIEFTWPNLLVSVPLHQRRAWRRGYNQTALLARLLAHWLQLDYAADLLCRRHSGSPQHTLSAQQRQHNLDNAYYLTRPVADLDIALLDDIVTTGSTANTIARLLKQQGAASVQVWCLCRTL